MHFDTFSVRGTFILVNFEIFLVFSTQGSAATAGGRPRHRETTGGLAGASRASVCGVVLSQSCVFMDFQGLSLKTDTNWSFYCSARGKEGRGASLRAKLETLTLDPSFPNRECPESLPRVPGGTPGLREHFPSSKRKYTRQKVKMYSIFGSANKPQLRRSKEQNK